MITVLKEISQTLKEILAELKKQKEPIGLTIDSSDIKDKFNLLYCQDDRKKHRLSGRQI